MATKTTAQIEFKAVTSEFDDGIKSMDQSLSTLRKELNLNSAELKENADNVDLLSKRKELLEKQAEASADKIELLKNKLSEAERIFGSNSKEVQQLNNKLLDSQTAHQKIQNEITQTNNKIEEFSSESYKVKKAMDSVENSSDELTNSFGAMEVAVGTLVADGIQNLTGALKDLVVESDEAFSKFQASTGTTTEEMQKFEDSIEELYSKNYGDSISDVANTMALVRQQMKGLSDNELKSVTQNALVLRDTFDMDVNESIRGITGLMQNMGLKSDEAFDYVVKGSQNGLNKSNELMDNIAEYSQLWGQAGFSAEDMFTILQNGLDSGAYNLDKVNDFVKEFGISLSDGRIGDNISSFSKGTQDLFKQWQNGEASTKDVFNSVINDLSSMENEQEALTLASNVWSALGEDNAMAVITSLNDVNDTYKDVKGTMDEVNNVRHDNVSSQLKEIGRTIQTDFLIPLGEELLPVLKDMFGWLKENLNWLVPTLTTLGIMFGTYFAVSKFMSLIGVITQIINLVKTGTSVMSALNIVMNLNPIGLIVMAIAGLVTAFVLLWNNCEGFREFWIGLWETIKTAVSTAWEWIKSVFTTIGGFLSTIGQWIYDNVINPIVNFFMGLWNSIVEIFSPIVSWYTELFTSVWESIKSILNVIVGLFKGTWEIIKAVWGIVADWFNNTVIEPIKNFFTPIVQWFKDIFTKAWTGVKKVFEPVKNFFSDLWKGIKNAFGNVADWFKNTFSKAWNNVKNIFSVGGKIFDGIKDGIAGVFKTVVNGIIGGINKVISVPFNAINGLLNKIRNVEILDFKPFKGFWKQNPLSVPQIPKLATGDVAKPNDPYIAMLGDNKREEEVISPLSTMKQANIEALDEYANRNANNYDFDRLVDVCEQILDKKIDMYIDKTKVGEAMAETNDNVSGKRYNFKNRGVLV